MPSPSSKPTASFTDSVPGLLRTAREHLQRRQFGEAARCFLEVSRRQPECFEAFWCLGQILFQANQHSEALLCLQRAAKLQPATPHLHLLLGALYKRLGRFEEAAECCRKELVLCPNNADVHYNLGLVLQNLGRFEQAEGAYREALRLKPDYLDARINLSGVLRQQARWEQALECLNQALQRVPDSAEAHWERCVTLLTLGRFEEGWSEYEWRWKLRDFTTPAALYTQPRWDGAPLQGKRIFLHCEQGYGDIIQFARYATLVAQRQGEVILGCPPALEPILKTVPGVKEVATRPSQLPVFDVQAPLLSLPALFGTSLQSVPAQAPYLKAPADAFTLPASPAGSLKIGLVWAGDPRHRNDRNRSLALEHVIPLLKEPGTQWYSLQAGPRAEDLHRLGLGSQLLDLGSRFQDFGQTAAAIAQLDLVISVDTAVAHLAGALGKRVWTLLPLEAEWRWMLGREDSPWYPTMRLFRQSRAGDWAELLQRVSPALKALLGGA